jgi:hypothetical protein
MKEEWKWIKNFKGLYKISNKGRVKSYHKSKDGKILSSKNVSSYECITLCKNGKRFYRKIHRLVGKHFIDNPKNKPEINHIDCNKHNNKVTNLEWVTSRENSLHAYKNNPDMINGMIDYNKNERPKTILQLDKETNEVISEFNNSKKAEKATGVCYRNILQVANKREFSPGRTRKQAGGFKWVFKEEYNQ